MSIVLASASPRRKELLEMLGVSDLKVIPATGEETAPEGAGPEEMVMAISSAKAMEVSKLCDRSDVVIAADTIVWHHGRVYGKPHSRQEAIEMLESLSGDTHQVFTGVTVMHNGHLNVQSEMSRVSFRQLTRQEIERYVDTGEAYGQSRRLRRTGQRLSLCPRDIRRLFQRYGSAAVQTGGNAQ